MLKLSPQDKIKELLSIKGFTTSDKMFLDKHHFELQPDGRYLSPAFIGRTDSTYRNYDLIVELEDGQFYLYTMRVVGQMSLMASRSSFGRMKADISPYIKPKTEKELSARPKR